MLKPVGMTEVHAKMTEVASRLNSMPLSLKIAELKRSRSPDRIQQIQSEAIVDLYDAVKQLQEAVWPILLLIPDGIDAAREAAKKSGSSSSSMLSAGSTLTPGTRFTR